MGRWLHRGEQPSLQEMLDDPIMSQLMARDGVTRGEIEELVRSLQKNRATDESPASGRASDEQAMPAEVVDDSLWPEGCRGSGRTESSTY